MWRAFGGCALIGWALGLISVAATTGLRGFYAFVEALGMGLIFSFFGLLVILVNRKTRRFNGAYLATAIIGGLVILGSIYGATNP